MNKWMIIPIVAGVITLGGVALASNLSSSTAAPEQDVLSMQQAEELVNKEIGGTIKEIGQNRDNVVINEKEAVGEVTNKQANKEQKSVQSVEMLTKEEAIAIAKTKAPHATLEEIELDTDDGRKIYEIEMRDSEFEYEFDIDAVTGDILEFEKDRYRLMVKPDATKVEKNNVEVAQPKVKTENKSVKPSKITIEQAIAIAKKHGKGMVTEVELDDHVYEIEMKDGRIEYEIEIDVFTGTVVSFEIDDD